VLQNIGQILQKGGIRRLGTGRVTTGHSSVAIDQEFLEIPADVAGEAVLRGGQPAVQRIPLGADDVDLRRQGRNGAMTSGLPSSPCTLNS
jgi:hypothetical protein